MFIILYIKNTVLVDSFVVDEKSASFFCGSIDVSPDGMKAIVTLSSGDMRRSLNILQVQYNDRCRMFYSLIYLLCYYMVSALTGKPPTDCGFRAPAWRMGR